MSQIGRVLVSAKQCILIDDKKCDSCGECDRCDMNPSVACTDCGVCLAVADFRAIEITDILFQQEGPDSAQQETADESDNVTETVPSWASNPTVARKPFRFVRKTK